LSKLKPCPFCGGAAEVRREPMWRGSHGYHGCYGYSVVCENDKCSIRPRTQVYDTIYEPDESKQKGKAIAAWNHRMKGKANDNE